jgi:dTDP-4-dehydrorhamnose reductase
MSPRSKILLTGSRGQVGWELARSLSTLGEVIALDSSRLNLTDAEAIRRAVTEIRPRIIVNPAAHTAVDKAESEPDLAHALNATAPAILAEEAECLGAPARRMPRPVRSTFTVPANWQANRRSRPTAGVI